MQAILAAKHYGAQAQPFSKFSRHGLFRNARGYSHADFVLTGAVQCNNYGRQMFAENGPLCNVPVREWANV